MKPPLLMRSEITGRVYVVTSYRELPDGTIEARTKHDVTDQYEAIRDAGPPSLRRIVQVLGDTYRDEGIAIWLTNRNQWLDGSRPLDLVRDGHADRVLEAAERIEGGL